MIQGKNNFLKIYCVAQSLQEIWIFPANISKEIEFLTNNRCCRRKIPRKTKVKKVLGYEWSPQVV